MNFRGVLVGVCVGVAACGNASAALPALCQDAGLTEIRSLVDLPEEVRSLLGADVSGTSGIADRGQKFNATDLVDSALPFRRFVLAGVSAECVLVSVERGGRAHSFRFVAFVKPANGPWQLVRDHVATQPNSLDELRAGEE